MESYLHPSVHFSGPFAKLQEKDQVLEGAKNFQNLFEILSIRAKSATSDQAMFVYDLHCGGAIGSIPTAALLRFKEGKIASIA